MISPVRIEPDAVYDDGVLYVNLGISSSALARARRERRLRYVRQGNRILYLGQWLIDWFSGIAVGASQCPEPVGRATLLPEEDLT